MSCLFTTTVAIYTLSLTKLATTNAASHKAKSFHSTEKLCKYERQQSLSLVKAIATKKLKVNKTLRAIAWLDADI